MIRRQVEQIERDVAPELRVRHAERDAIEAVESVARTGALVTPEEGTLTRGFGAEIAARVQQAAWSDLRAPVQRVAARDGIIPSARPLEDDMLPSVDDVVAAVSALDGVRS